MTIISPYMPSPDEKSQRTRQNDAANQRDSWLRQMELAQLSEMGKSSASHRTDENANKSDASSRTDENTNKSSDSVRQVMSTAHAAVGENHQSVSGHNPAQASQEAVQTSVQADATNDAQSSSEANNHTTHGHGAEPASGIQAQQGQTIPFSASALLAAQALAGSAAASIGKSATQTTVLQFVSAQQQSVDTPMVQVVPTRALPFPGLTALTNSEQQDEMSIDEENAPLKSAKTEAQQGEKPTWQKRMMHIISEGQDVNVWIRDRELNTTQAATLVYRLASDISGMGLRLNGATVNGKPAFRSANVESQSRSRSTTATREQNSDTENSTITTTEEDHGS